MERETEKPPRRDSSRSEDARTPAHILVVDDDLRLRNLLRRYLEGHGCRVTLAASADAAERKMRSILFDLLILDVMMPGKSGIDFARQLKSGDSPPVLMLTARSDIENRIEGLEAGVDDYLPKPFEPRELLLRARAILRRRPWSGRAEGSVVPLGACLYDPSTGQITRNGAPVSLSFQERQLLEIFIASPGRIFSRAELMGGGRGRVDDGARAVDVRINRLRRKIETNPSQPLCLQTARGRGYVLYPVRDDGGR